MRGEDSEFREFVAARLPALLSFAHVLTGNRWDAEDVVQTALVNSALGWHRLRDGGSAERYVRQAIVRTHLNVLRRRPWREQPTADPPEHADPVAGERVVDERDAMWQALAALPPRQRAVVVLRYYEDLSEAQIADVLGCSRGTVKSQCAKALAALRRTVEPGGQGRVIDLGEVATTAEGQPGGRGA